jgi:hypothetical protein
MALLGMSHIGGIMAATPASFDPQPLILDCQAARNLPVSVELTAQQTQKKWFLTTASTASSHIN